MPPPNGCRILRLEMKRQVQSLNGKSSAAGFLDFDHDAAKPQIARSRFQPNRDLPQEAVHRQVRHGADDGIVCTCVRVPITALTRPSIYHPIACFSEVASAWKSTMMMGVCFRMPSKASIPVRNGQSTLAMKTRP